MDIQVQLQSDLQRLELFGPSDQHLRLLRDDLHIKVTARNGTILLSGPEPEVRRAADILDRMQKRLIKRGHLNEQDVKEILEQSRHEMRPQRDEVIEVYSNKGVIEPFTKGQLHYIKTMFKNDLTFCIGPAGTGKTYLAVAVAVSMLKKKQIRRMVLARPAVEAGERLGFLPGDLQAKVNPYLRPLFDSLEDMMEFGQMASYGNGHYRVIPLALMPGPDTQRSRHLYILRHSRPKR